MQGTKAKIALNGEFGAEALDGILIELAKVRASLEPAVPAEPPSALSDAELLEQTETLFKIRTLVDGGVRIWLRHEGFGWLPFTLSPADAAGIRDFLGKKIGHTHTAH